MMVFEVGQQLEHYDALFLEVGLDLSELDLEVSSQDGLFVHSFQKFAVALWEREDILEGLKNMVQVQKALVRDVGEVPVVQKTHFFKVLRGRYALL